ncbi:MAG TPA: BspA family leucine-rich repeat surface protein [Candidatus Aveggerthella excrementigallinarum]|nr:BspA family leucine-rich repeat surface protein [Candidatus Aveggerthella excrementigallinarum]
MAEKTLRSVLACLMAIVLIAGLLPVMPREAAAEEEASIAANNSEGWQQFDECEWRIDDSGCLTIRPANGVTGKIGIADIDDRPNASRLWPWDDARWSVRSLVIKEGVKGERSLESMFNYCVGLEAVDLSGLDTSNVTDMHSMFNRCRSLTSIDVSGFDTSSVTDMGFMFYDCTSLTSIDVSSFDTSSVTDMGGMFRDCSSLTALDLSNFDTSDVTSMIWMFYNCSSLTALDLSSFDTSNVTDMLLMFSDCSNLTSLDLSNFDTSSVTRMHDMFGGCSSLTALDISSFDTSSVTDMGFMFYHCSSLTSLDLSNFDTSDVTSMIWMFINCSSLTSLDLSNFDTSSVTDMGGMFWNCSSLASLDLSSFDTSNVTDMRHMFDGCSSLASLDLSSFDTSSVTDMGGMFWIFNGCSSLTEISFGVWSAKLAAELEQPDSSISGADGYWYNSAGKAFKPVDIPTDVADTYYASKLLVQNPGNFEATIGFKATIGGKDAYTTVEWDDRWFDIGSTKYASFSGSSMSFNNELHELATTAAVLSGAAYDEGLMKEALNKLGFDELDPNYPSESDYDDEGKGGIDQVAYTFGIRETAQGYPIIAVVVRGTPSNVEWLSNLNIANTAQGDIGMHEGFNRAASRVMTELSRYLDEQGVDDLSNARVLITGHSRGAAVANVLGMKLTTGSTELAQQLSEGRVYDFTFASPTTARNPDRGCDNIYNIVNPEDAVTGVPLSLWGYGRHGKTLVLPSRSNAANYSAAYKTMNTTFRAYAGADYLPYGKAAQSAEIAADAVYGLASDVDEYYNRHHISTNLGADIVYGGGYTTHQFLQFVGNAFWGGNVADKITGGILGLSALTTTPAFAWTLAKMAYAGVVSESGIVFPCVKHGHTQETYVSWMQSGKPVNIFRGAYRGVKVACPVDVTVYDGNDEVVASIVNDVVDESIVDGLPAAVVDEVKMIDLPADGDYRIEITAREGGEMDFTVEELDGTGAAPPSVKSYQGITLEKGETYESEIEQGQQVETIELTEGEDGAAVEAANTVQGAGRYFNIAVEAEGNGDAWGGGEKLAGSQATVHAAAADGSVFDGWYVDGKKISSETDYTVRVSGALELVARFAEQPGSGEGEEEDGPSEPTEPSNPSNPSTPTTPADHEVSLGFDAALGDVSVSPESAKAGETVTVTAVPLPGYEVGSVTVTDASGEAVGVAEADGGKRTFSMPDGDVDVAVEFAPTAWENPFSDVSEDDWFYDQVRRANLLGLMKGYDGTVLFGPDDGLMREQAATVMWNLMGAGDVSRPAAPQADVDQSQWYAPYVNWAVDSKVMDGYDTGSFGVGDLLTREQFAAVVAKAVGADVDSADQAALGAFPDADGVSGWARATMAWAVEAGVLNGVETEDGSRELQAGRTLTRAEMATMMMNAIDKGVLKLSE